MLQTRYSMRTLFLMLRKQSALCNCSISMFAVVAERSALKYCISWLSQKYLLTQLISDVGSNRFLMGVFWRCPYATSKSVSNGLNGEFIVSLSRELTEVLRFYLGVLSLRSVPLRFWTDPFEVSLVSTLWAEFHFHTFVPICWRKLTELTISNFYIHGTLIVFNIYGFSRCCTWSRAHTMLCCFDSVRVFHCFW